MKVLIQGKALSLTELLAQYGIENENEKISIKSSRSFENTLFDRIWELEKQLKKMLPKKPPIEQEPSRTEQEYIPFEGPASIWIDDNRSESEKYRTEPKSPEQFQREMKSYTEYVRNYGDLLEQYNKQAEEIQSSDDYLRKNQELQALQEVKKAYFSSMKIPEFDDVKSKLAHAIKTSGTSREGGNRILAEIDRLEQLDLDPETKVARTIDFMLQEYRHILRGGLTGMIPTETGSRLAENLQAFSKETLGIELPKSLEKGQPLTVESLHRQGKVDMALYEQMTSPSPQHEHESQIHLSI